MLRLRCVYEFLLIFFFLSLLRQPTSTRPDTLFPDTTRFRSDLHWRRGRRRAVRRRRRWSASCGERPCECLFELIVLDDLRGRIDMLARADPAHAHGAAFVAGGFDPVGNPLIAMREYDRARTIGSDPGAVLVDVNVMVAIVQRLHTQVIELQIAEPAFGNADRKGTRQNSS